MDAELAASYGRCRRLLAQHGRSYHLASRLLPRVMQPAVWALYGFARHVDDLVDVAIDRTPSPTIIDAIETQLRSGIATGQTHHPILAATVDTVRRYDIDPQWLIDFLTAMRMDLAPRTFGSWSELSTYTWGSASVIGLQMAQVIGVQRDAERAQACASALGQAFQITNFCRDYDEDRLRGRVYLPIELFATHGIEPGSIEPGGVRRVISDASAYARELYREAAPGIGLLDRRGQPCIRAAFSLYQGILDEIEHANYDVLSKRHRVGSLHRLQIAAPLLAQSIAARIRTHPAPHGQH